MKSSRILRKIIAGSMAIAMVAGTGVSVSTGNLLGTNVAVSAAETLTEGDFEYQINDAGTVTTVKYNGSAANVTVPSKINGVAVEVIGAGTFRGSSVVQKVTLPSTIKKIDANSFRDSTVTSVNFPAGLTEIGDAAFYRCYYLKNVTFPAGLQRIGQSAFEECKLFTKVTLPANLPEMGGYAFKNCSSVTSVTLSQTMTTVPSGTFQGTYISEVTIPAAVERIDSYAFYACRNLKKVTFAEGSALQTVGYEAFREDTALQSIAFPDTFQKIDGYAFYNCRSLQSITFGAGFKGVEYNAFQNCTNLTNLTLPDNIEYVASNSFNGCVSLQWVKLGGLKRIYSSAFENCVSLTKVYFGEGFERMDNSAFYNTPKLTTFYNIPNKYIYLEDHCLDGSGWMSKQPDGIVYFGNVTITVKGGVTDVTLKDGTQWINDTTFKNSSGLKSITIPSSIVSDKEPNFFNIFDKCGNTLEAINIDENDTRYKSVDGIVYSKDGKKMIYCPKAKSGTVTLSDTVETIGNSALRDCDKITALKFGLNTRYIDTYDICTMNALKSVTVPTDNIYFSDDSGVLYNKGKTNLYVYPAQKTGAYTMPDTVSDIYYYAFSTAEKLTELNVPAATRNLYLSYFSKTSALKAINVNENNQWHSSVNGVVYNKDKTTLWYVPEKYEGELSIPDTVTRIDGEYTFRNCTGITKLTIPASVTNAGDNCFDNCFSITEFAVDPESTRFASENGCLMNTAKDYIYAFPKGAATVTIPESIVSYGRIRDAATNNCPNLVTLNLSTNFNDFNAYYKFENCPKFTTITVSANNPTYTAVDGVLYNKAKTQIVFVPGGKTGAYTAPITVTSIYDRAFKDARKLTSITFQKNFTSTFDMGYVMENCESLTALNFASTNTDYATVDGVVYRKDMTELYYVPNGKKGAYTVPDTVTNIQNSRAFKNCSNLTSIVFPASVRKLNFETTGMTSLTSVTIPATVTEISARFYDLPNVTISGYEGSYAEMYSNYNDVKFKKLANSISLNKTSVETAEGRTVKLTASIDTARTTDKTVTWKSENTKVATVAKDGTITAVAAGVTRVSAATSDGKVVFCNVLVNAPLTNTSAVSADSILTGKSVTLDGSAFGGVKDYQYNMLYKLSSASSWTTLSSYSTTASKEFTPASAGTYDICIKVKDKDSIETKKFFTLQVNDALKNTSSVSANTLTIGEMLAVVGDSAGGTGNTTYKYEQKLSTASAWTTIADYSAKTAVLFKPAKTGAYSVRVTAKDSSGNTAVQTLTVNVADVLANTSKISADTINLGESVSVTASATGGKGSYTYAYFCKEFTAKSWTKVADFSTNAAASVTPKTAGYYQICVKVKDADGTIAKEYYNVVVKEKQNALTNTSTVSAAQIKLGERVGVSASATGGTAPYTYAVLYKKTTDTKWTTKQDFGTASEISVLPSKNADYIICVKVKDANGTVVEKTFNVKVEASQEALQNDSTIVSDEVILGSSLTVNAAAKGGTGNYTYAVLYKKKTDTTWVTKQNFTSNATVTVKPSNATEYDLCVKVKDDSGTIVKKYFTFHVIDSIKNTSTVNVDSISLGGTVTMKGSATGGTAPYTYAFYYKKSSASSWVEKQKYSTNNTVSIKPTQAVDYDICIKAMDADGVVDKKYFKVTVK